MTSKSLRLVALGMALGAGCAAQVAEPAASGADGVPGAQSEPAAPPALFPSPGRVGALPSAAAPAAAPAPEPVGGASAAWQAQVMARIEAGSYAIRRAESGLATSNHAQRLRARFARAAVKIELTPEPAAPDDSDLPALRPAPSQAGPEIELVTLGMARGSQKLAAGEGEFGTGACQTDGAVDEVDHCLPRAELRQPAWVEWWENRREGLEHGYDIAQAPLRSEEQQQEPLRIELGLTGAQIRVDEDGLGATLQMGHKSLRYAKLVALDAEQRTLPSRMIATEAGLALEVDDRGAAYPIRVDPLINVYSWQQESDSSLATYGFHVASAGDVNNDGYGDVVVGAYGYSNGNTYEGKVFMYKGTAVGLQTSPSWWAEGGQDGAFMGAVAGAGDVNNDGFGDVIVGAWQYDGTFVDEGRVDVYYGSADAFPLPWTPSWTRLGGQANAFFGFAVSSAGDRNCDRIGNVVIGAPRHSNPEVEEGRVYVFHGAAGGLGTTPYIKEYNVANLQLGYSVANAGNVDNDACGEVLAGGPGWSSGGMTDNGIVVLLWGGNGPVFGPVADFVGTLNHGAYGFSVAGAVDVNGDGFADFLVGAPSQTWGQSAEGRAFLYKGRALRASPQLIWTGEMNQAGATYGRSVASAGDVNGDGYADIIVGAPLYDSPEIDEGAAFVYFGRAAGPTTTPNWTRDSNWTGANFGTAVASAGDTDGNGYSEVLIGAPLYDNSQADEGRVSMFAGFASDYTTTPGWTVLGTVQDDFLGYAVGSAGDVNGDGFDDVLVGTPYYDGGQTNEGRVRLYLGAAGGPSTTAVWSPEPNMAGAQFGVYVASAGDVNGDGYGDMLVGAPEYNSGGQVREGAVYFYLGSSTGIPAVAPVIIESNQAEALMGKVASAGDVNGDGYGDVLVGARSYTNGQTREGVVFLYYGSAAGLSPTPLLLEANVANASFGHELASAGDVNRDGYGDVIIGAPYYNGGNANEGKAFVYRGGSTGLVTTPVWAEEGNMTGANFGYSVAGLGDTNGDGFGDILVGIPNYTNGQLQEGAVRLYFGHSTGVNSVPNTTWEGNVALTQLGNRVASAGDFNGDGLGDALMASYSNAGFTGFVRPCYGAGPNFVPGLLCFTPQINGDQGSSFFGIGLGAADVNGDGFSDILVGTSEYDNGGVVDAGRATLYYGNAADGAIGIARRPQARRPNLTTAIHPAGKSYSTTGFDAAILTKQAPFGYTRMKIQVEAKPVGTPFDGTNLLNSGWTWSSNSAFKQFVSAAQGSRMHWRVRLVWNQSHNPWFQRTRWLYGGLAGHSQATDVLIAP